MRISPILLAAVAAAVICTLSIVSIPTHAQTCLDENGNAVDWFLILKIASRYGSSYPSIGEGTAYLYGDSNSYSGTPDEFWTNSSHAISDVESSVGRTVEQIYSNASNTTDFGYLMYNDETPAGIWSETYGHSKGHLAWSASGQKGFWLIHSVPKFADSPKRVKAYKYPWNGHVYGQHMFCLTLNLKNIDTAFEQFPYTNPQVYGAQFVSSLKVQMPNMNAFMNEGLVYNTTSKTNIVDIETMEGFTIKHFAKTAKWGSSIYGDLIGPYYSTEMMVETWQNPYQLPYLSPNVTEDVYSILGLAAPAYAAWDGIEWGMINDHAKWGLSLLDFNVTGPITGNITANLFCIGDINKQLSQWVRSGGMACMTDNVLYNAFNSLVTVTDLS